MSKRIHVIDANGQKRKIKVANEDEFSRRFNELNLLDVDGYEISGYASLEDGMTYTSFLVDTVETLATNVSHVYPSLRRETATPPHAAATVALPPSPPRDGIRVAPFYLPRTRLVSRLINLAKSTVILRSPPATGKTSLVDLVEMHLMEQPSTAARIIRISIGQHVDDEGLIGSLVKQIGVDCHAIGRLQGDTWILIDDAQLAFDALRFWKIIVKDFASIAGVNVIIAGTYDLVSQGSTPFSFRERNHISDLLLTKAESEELYDGYAFKSHFLKGWTSFRDTLLRLAGGHVGVLTGGLSMVNRIQVDEQRRLTESEALEALRDHRFRVNLNRCFPCEKLMSDKQRSAVAERLIAGPASIIINAAQGSTDDDSLVQLVRAGIFSAEGSFSCLVAQSLYYNSFFSRASEEEAPKSIENLVVRGVKSLSALRLRQSCDISSGGRQFPKEAAFQQLFNEAFTRQLPANVAVCPELNTFAENLQGKVISGELDFFIGSNRFWAIEILRNGDKINEHVARFDATDGRYRKVGYTDYLVVDCRGPLTKHVQTIQSRCTLYFSDDFKTVQCKMREEALQELTLEH